MRAPELLCLAAASLAGCASVAAPGNYFPNGGQNIHGGFIDLCVHGPTADHAPGVWRRAGELVAVDARNFYIMESVPEGAQPGLNDCESEVTWSLPRDPHQHLAGLQKIPVAWVTSARVVDRTPASGAAVGGMVGFSLAGLVSTISNGYYLLFTAPAWVVVGAVCIGQAASPGERTAAYPHDSVVTFATFARFPQGLPPREKEDVEPPAPPTVPPPASAPWVPGAPPPLPPPLPAVLSPPPPASPASPEPNVKGVPPAPLGAAAPAPAPPATPAPAPPVHPAQLPNDISGIGE